MPRHSRRTDKSKAYRSYQMLSLKGKSGAKRAAAAAEVATAAAAHRKPFHSKRHHKLKKEGKLADATRLPNQDLPPTGADSGGPATVMVSLMGEEWACDAPQLGGSRSARHVAKLAAQTKALAHLTPSARRKALRQQNVAGRRAGGEDTYGAGRQLGRGPAASSAAAMKRQPRESEGRFMARVDRVAADTVMRARYAAKYGMTPEQVEGGGDGAVAKLRGRKAKKSARRLKERKVQAREKESAARVARRSVTGFEHLGDRVRFGEVVEAPPKLQTLPRLPNRPAPGARKKVGHTLDNQLTT